MRTAHKVWCGIAAATFCLVALGDMAGPTTPVRPAAPAAVSAPAAPVAAPAPIAAPAPAVAAPPPVETAAPAAEPTVTVTDVTDGDTFTAGGEKIRVLGIDSCEMSTAGGAQAKSTAEALLEGQPVVLRAEPGVDEDRYGRKLRYVEMASGQDFGDSMVVYDHTGVYENRNDAADAYVQRLRTEDPNGRVCSAPSVTDTGATDDGDDDDTVIVPRPGDQGMRDGALTGGYCRKKWWC